MERQKVENPFSTPIKKVKYQPDLQSRALPRSAFTSGPSKGQYIMDSLIKFAGVAGDAYVKNVEKNIGIDKAIQSSRAVQGAAPTDDATVAGYRAHSAIAIKKKVLQAQAELAALASTDATDEEWENAIRGKFKRMDEELSTEYSRYSSDQEMQKLAVVALREAIPSVTAKREAVKMEKEIQSRIDDATDVLINAAKVSNGLVLADPKELSSLTGGMLSSLKLTAHQKDEVVIKAIENTRNPQLIELSKHYTGDRKTSLYERNGRIQAIDKRNRSEAASMNVAALANERFEFEKQVLGDPLTGKEPTLTTDEALMRIDRRNKATDNKFMSQSQIYSLLKKKEAAVIEAYKIKQVKKDLLDDSDANLKEYEHATVQNALREILRDGLNKISKGAEEALDPESYIATESRKLISIVADKSVKSDALYDDWLGGLNQLANLNVPDVLETRNIKESTLTSLPKHINEIIFTVDSMAPQTQEKYFSSLGAREERIVRSFFKFREVGDPLTVALSKAQETIRNPKPYDKEEVDKVVQDVFDDQEYFWWRKDIPDNQRDYIDSYVREMAANGSTSNQISGTMLHNWTVLDSGARVKGSPQQLQKATGLWPTRLDAGFKGFIKSMEHVILPAISNSGYTMDDVFVVTDPDTSTMQLRTPYGIVPGSTRSLSDVRQFAKSYKHEIEKKELSSQEKVQQFQRESGMLDDSFSDTKRSPRTGRNSITYKTPEEETQTSKLVQEMQRKAGLL